MKNWVVNSTTFYFTMEIKKIIAFQAIIFIFCILNMNNVIADYIDDMNNQITTYVMLEEAASPFDNAKGGTDPTCTACPTFQQAGIIDFGVDLISLNTDRIFFNINTGVSMKKSWGGWIAPDANGDFIICDSDVILSMFVGQPYGLGSANRYSCSVYDGANKVVTSTTAVTFGAYQHVVCTYDPTGSELQIYVGGALEGTLAVGNLIATNKALCFGSRCNAGALYYDGDMDEMFYYDAYTLNSTHVEFLYNAGAPTSDQQYPFVAGGDVTPPVITLIYPINTTHYNDYNGSIIINATDNVAVDDCNINNTDWDKQGVLGINWLWNRTITPDANYSIFVECNDSSDNVANITFWFVVDETDPVSILFSPLNKSTQSTNFNVSVSYQDTYLFRTNTTILNSTGVVMFNNYSGDLGSTTWYNFTTFINVSSWPEGNYTLLRQATDTHTDKVFDESKTVEIEDAIFALRKSKTYKFKYGDIIFEFDNQDKFNIYDIRERDRIVQVFDVADTKIKTFTIYADNIIYLEDSKYPCHLIINDHYWYDCDGMPRPTVKVIDEEEVRISFIPDKIGTFNTESIGGLNFINLSSWFLYLLSSPATAGCVIDIVPSFGYDDPPVPRIEPETVSTCVTIIENNESLAVAYGEMWNKTGSTSPYTFTIAALGIYYNLTGLVDGALYDFTTTHTTQANGGSFLTIGSDGTYKVDATISWIASVAGGTYGFAVSHNFTVEDHRNCYSRRQASNSVGNVGVTCIMADLIGGDTINIQVEDETAPARDIQIHNVNINLVRIRE